MAAGQIGTKDEDFVGGEVSDLGRGSFHWRWVCAESSGRLDRNRAVMAVQDEHPSRRGRTSSRLAVGGLATAQPADARAHRDRRVDLQHPWRCAAERLGVDILDLPARFLWDRGRGPKAKKTASCCPWRRIYAPGYQFRRMRLHLKGIKLDSLSSHDFWVLS